MNYLATNDQYGINDTNLAVQITNGYKSYKKVSVLKNLNLNLPSGAIYGLLGPSGCGKLAIKSYLDWLYNMHFKIV